MLRKVFLIEPASRATKAYLKKAVRFFSLKKIAVECWCRDQLFESRLHHSYLSAPDKVRFEALVKAFKSDADLVVCVRGGYGSVRLLKRIKKPINSKFLLGFSDVSALQLSGKIKNSIHGSWEWLKIQQNWETLKSILAQKHFSLRLKSRLKLAAKVIASNLSILCSLLGTPFLGNPENDFILILEDTNEPLYRIDRMIFQVVNSHFLKKCKGILLGDFDYKGKKYSYNILEVILKEAGFLGKIGRFPIGHMGGFIVPQFWILDLGHSRATFLPA